MLDKTFVIMIGASYVSAGVKGDGGGYVIVNGKVIRIPPRSPLFAQLAAATTLLEHSEAVTDSAIREQMTKMGETLMTKTAEELIHSGCHDGK